MSFECSVKMLITSERKQHCSSCIDHWKAWNQHFRFPKPLKQGMSQSKALLGPGTKEKSPSALDKGKVQMLVKIKMPWFLLGQLDPEPRNLWILSDYLHFIQFCFFNDLTCAGLQHLWISWKYLFGLLAVAHCRQGHILLHQSLLHLRRRHGLGSSY